MAPKTLAPDMAMVLPAPAVAMGAVAAVVEPEAVEVPGRLPVPAGLVAEEAVVVLLE